MKPPKQNKQTNKKPNQNCPYQWAAAINKTGLPYSTMGFVFVQDIRMQPAPHQPASLWGKQEYHTGSHQHTPAKGTLWCFPAAHPVCPLLSKAVFSLFSRLFSSAFIANSLVHHQAEPINVIFTAEEEEGSSINSLLFTSRTH